MQRVPCLHLDKTWRVHDEASLPDDLEWECVGKQEFLFGRLCQCLALSKLCVTNTAFNMYTSDTVSKKTFFSIFPGQDNICKVNLYWHILLWAHSLCKHNGSYVFHAWLQRCIISVVPILCVMDVVLSRHKQWKWSVDCHINIQLSVCVE